MSEKFSSGRKNPKPKNKQKLYFPWYKSVYCILNTIDMDLKKYQLTQIVVYKSHISHYKSHITQLQIYIT